MPVVFAVVLELNPASSTETPDLSIVTVLRNTGNLQTGQRLNVADQRPVGGRNNHHLVFGIKRSHHVLNAGIIPPGFGIDFIQERHTIGSRHLGLRPFDRIQVSGRSALGRHRNGGISLGGIGDVARGIGRNLQVFFRQFIRVGKPCFFTGGRTDSDPLRHAFCRAFNDAFLHRNRFRDAGLEVQVRVINILHVQTIERVLGFEFGDTEFG